MAVIDVGVEDSDLLVDAGMRLVIPHAFNVDAIFVAGVADPGFVCDTP